MTTFFTIAATLCAIPQLFPQFHRIRTTGRAQGVSMSWAALTATSNLAWLGYFVASDLWSGTIPVGSSALLATAICWALTQIGQSPVRPALIAAGWAIVLGGSAALGGTTALGAVLAVAFAIQMIPSLWVAVKSPSREGISRSTWFLVAGEVSCWGVVGLLENRIPLLVLGVIGTTSAAIMLTLSARSTSAAPAAA